MVARTQEEIDKIVTENIALAQWFANRSGDADRDEAFSAAMAGLLKAAEKFDPEKGKFGTYASRAIKSHIHRVYLKRNRIRRGGRETIVSLNDLVGNDSDTELGDLIPDTKSDPVDEAQVNEGVAQLIPKLCYLSDREEHVIRNRFGIGCDPCTLELIGTGLGISREAVRLIQVRAVNKLRLAMAGKLTKKPARKAHHNIKLRPKMLPSGPPPTHCSCGCGKPLRHGTWFVTGHYWKWRRDQEQAAA